MMCIWWMHLFLWLVSGEYMIYIMNTRFVLGEYIIY